MMDNRPELFEEIKLCKSVKEKERYDNLANLFAIITTIQQLEKAYSKDCVTAKEYTGACSNLLAQYKSAFKLVENEFKTIEDFVKKYKLDAPIALERIKEDRPVTIKDDKGNTNKCIAEIVSLFITVMDKLRLNIRANDEIQPDLRDLYDVINRLSILPPDFEGKSRVHKWLNKLQAMSAAQELDDTEIRDILFDLETGYHSFQKILHDL